MSLATKLLRNLLLLAAGLFLLLGVLGFHLSPQAALNARERGADYRPSKILFQLETADDPYVFAASGDRYGLVAIERTWGIFWSTGSFGTHRLTGESPVESRPFLINATGDGLVVAVHRTTPTVSAVQISFEDGGAVTLDQWREDWCLYYAPDRTIRDVFTVQAISN